MPLDPEVLDPDVPAGAVPPEVPAVLADESPSTPADVEPTLTGAVTGAATCVPEATPSEPLVVAAGVAAAGVLPVFEGAPDVADESPPTPAAVAPMLTGTNIGATT